jgi:hypothetical protein
MNISRVCAACYQNVEISDRWPASTLLCSGIEISHLGFRQFKSKNSISDTCWELEDLPYLFSLVIQEIQWSIMTTAVRCKVLTTTDLREACSQLCRFLM